MTIVSFISEKGIHIDWNILCNVKAQKHLMKQNDSQKHSKTPNSQEIDDTIILTLELFGCGTSLT